QVLNESLKISFQDLIARYRIRKACQLLRDEEHEKLKVESIAAMVGYNSKSSFNSAFKRRTGVTPTEYRESKSVRSYGETLLSERERPSDEVRKFSLNHVFTKMNQTMILISFRNLRKHKLHSSLNILGLAIGLAACFTIAAYVHYEWSYDNHHPNSENIYRIALNRIYPDYNKEWAITAPILGSTLTERLPEVQHYTRLSWDNFMFGREGEILKEQRITVVDSGFFQIFDATILNGKVTNDFFKKNDGIILTETAARKYFGNENPVGKLFNLQLPKGGKRLVSVAAVISDPRPNSHFSYEVLGTLEMLQFPDFVMNMWGMWAAYTYIKVHPDTKPEILASRINDLTNEYMALGNDDFEAWLDAGNLYQYFLQPLTGIHLNSHLAEEFEANSSEVFVYFFALVGVFILMMAIVNFVNMATARASYRTLEVGIRKSVGASRWDLMIQFLMESIMISLIALLVALPITQLFLPYFNEIVGKSISLALFYSPFGIFILMVTPIVLGILSGFYPALYLSNFGPAAVFQKLIVKRGRESVRHLLVIGQFIIAVVLMASTITVFHQMHYMTTKPLGFDKDQLIKVDRLPFIGDKIDLFKQQAIKVPGVHGVSTSSFPLDEIREGSTIRPKDNPDGWVNTTTLCVDENYLPTTGIQLVAGRNFRPDEVEMTEGIEKIILNVAAAKALGWTPEEAVDQLVYVDEQQNRLVIGVAEDFNFSSLHKAVEPFQMTGWKFAIPARSATIRLDPRKTKESLAALESLWSEHSPEQEFEYEFVDESMAQYYQAERLTSKLFVIFSGLGIVICCLGLFGLMGYVVEQRSKEVGIRKVMGARIRQIILLLSKDYMRLVIVSSVIAIPIAWWGLNEWLDNFAYRVDNTVWIYLIAGILVTIISWVTVAFYAYQAAKTNPVNSLRSE
ncbi:MAG: FtsX-like permease family protein, partial [Bacteroidota bacterium]